MRALTSSAWLALLAFAGCGQFGEPMVTPVRSEHRPDWRGNTEPEPAVAGSAFAIGAGYDRLRGTTTASATFRTLLPLRVGDHEPSHRALIKVESVCAGRDCFAPGAPPRTATWTFRSRSETWEFLESHDLLLLIDDRRITIEGSQAGSVERGAVSEWVDIPLKPPVLAAIANGRSVEGQVGIFRFALSPEHLAMFRAFHALINPPAIDGK